MRLLLSIAVMFAGVLAGSRAAAPVPKGPKTTAEKLVGKWKCVKTTGPLSPQAVYTVEFTQKGKMISRVVMPNGPAEVFTKPFKVVGNTIHVKLGSPNLPDPWVITIDLLTDDRLAIVGPAETDRIKSEFVRIAELTWWW